MSDTRKLAEDYCRNGIVVSVDGIEAVVKAARNLALEEAAAICDEYVAAQPATLAARIRALKSDHEPEGGATGTGR